VSGFGQLAQRLLAGTEHDRVHFEALRFSRFSPKVMTSPASSIDS
jgi:hypothetical protein